MTTLPPVDRDQLIATRRDLHQHPELGFEERRTGALVAERLERLGYTVQKGVGKTGVVGVRDGAPQGNARCVLIRADMDALPIEEANDVPYRSQHPGKMHACGHDGHVAIGLEVARRFHAAYLPGAVKLAFQPAEEISNGAEAMIRDGVLDGPKVDAAFGIHLWNDLPAGTIALMPGPVMASVDEFEIAIVGRDRVIDGVRTMGGEDMSYFLARVPGAFAFVGSAPPGKKGSPHHSPTFDIDEESLVIGAELVSRTVVRYLEQGS